MKGVKLGLKVEHSENGAFLLVETAFFGAWLVNVFLIGYVDVAGFNVGDEKPPHD